MGNRQTITDAIYDHMYTQTEVNTQYSGNVTHICQIVIICKSRWMAAL